MVSTLPPMPDTPFGSHCTVRLGTAVCGRLRIHLGMTGRGDVHLCAHCDVGDIATAGPPRLVTYLRTGDKA